MVLERKGDSKTLYISTLFVINLFSDRFNKCFLENVLMLKSFQFKELFTVIFLKYLFFNFQHRKKSFKLLDRLTIKTSEFL